MTTNNIILVYMMLMCFVSIGTSLVPNYYVTKTSLPFFGLRPTPLINKNKRKYESPKACYLSKNNDNDGDKALPSIPVEWKGQILQSLSAIVDPDFNRDIVTLGFIQNLQLNEDTRKLSFDVELTTPACPIKDSFQTQCEEIVNSFPWTDGNAIVTMTSTPPISSPTANAGAPLGLSQVKAIIAVSSCKGGVGKSTTAVNLAYSLSNLGASVGIFDADVYGPSLPTMVKPDNDAVTFVGRQIAPLSRNGVKLMSFGYVNDGSAVMRGPMVTQLLDQFLSLTYWGPLDYLILDMPPGTGDIQLTLSQKLNITAAVIVTTPQELSFVDVERGIEMFDSVNVPCIAVVENMAYFQMPNSTSTPLLSESDEKLKQEIQQTLLNNGVNKESITLDRVTQEIINIVNKQIVVSNDANHQKSQDKIQIFGKGHKNRLSDQWGIEHTFSMPLLGQIATNGDSGIPFVLQYPNSPEADTYKSLASSVVREVVKVQYSKEASRPKVIYNEDENLLNIDGEVLVPAELRRDCKCAACVEEFSGRQILKPSDVSDLIKPTQMNPTGNYALSVDWSDGHRSLYPYRQIRTMMQSRRSDQVVQDRKEVQTSRV